MLAVAEEWLGRIEQRDTIAALEETIYALSAAWEHLGNDCARFSTRAATRLSAIAVSCGERFVPIVCREWSEFTMNMGRGGGV
jgi:hypothetical protein